MKPAAALAVAIARLGFETGDVAAAETLQGLLDDLSGHGSYPAAWRRAVQSLPAGLSRRRIAQQVALGQVKGIPAGTDIGDRQIGRWRGGT